jgi:hypothetical protein
MAKHHPVNATEKLNYSLLKEVKNLFEKTERGGDNEE